MSREDIISRGNDEDRDNQHDDDYAKGVINRETFHTRNTMEMSYHNMKSMDGNEEGHSVS